MYLVSVLSLVAPFSTTVNLTLCELNIILSKNINPRLEKCYSVFKVILEFMSVSTGYCFWFCGVRAHVCVHGLAQFPPSNAVVYFYLCYCHELVKEILFRVFLVASFSILRYLQM